MTEGGPQFCGDFPKFCTKHYISHELSSPYNPKSNGLAEAAVKSVKNILRKNYASGTDPATMLYEWRNMPRADGYYFSVGNSVLVPTLPSQIHPIDFSAAAISKDSAHERSKYDHDRSKTFLPPLSPGQAVLLQDPKTSAWTRKGVVSSIRPNHLSYTISMDDRFLIRPCCMLRAALLESDSPPAQAPAPITPSLPRRSKRLQSRATTLPIHTSANLSTLHPPPCSEVHNTSLMRSMKRNSLPNGRERRLPPLLPLPLSSSTMRPTYPSETNPRMSTSTNPIMAVSYTHLTLPTTPYV